MAATAVNLTTLPCPHCQHAVDERESVVGEAVRHGVDCLDLQCHSCGKTFTHYRELTRARAAEPAARRVLIATAAAAAEDKLPPTTLWHWFIAAVIALGVEFLSRPAGPHTFLIAYVTLFLACFASSSENGFSRRILGLACFEFTGGLRVHHALTIGHQNIFYLALMMGVGGVLLLVEWDSGFSAPGSRFSWDDSLTCDRYYSHHHYWGGCGGGWSSGGFGSGGGTSGGSGGGSSGGGGCGGCGS